MRRSFVVQRVGSEAHPGRFLKDLPVGGGHIRQLPRAPVHALLQEQVEIDVGLEARVDFPQEGEERVREQLDALVADLDQGVEHVVDGEVVAEGVAFDHTKPGVYGGCAIARPLDSSLWSWSRAWRAACGPARGHRRCNLSGHRRSLSSRPSSAKRGRPALPESPSRRPRCPSSRRVLTKLHEGFREHQRQLAVIGLGTVGVVRLDVVVLDAAPFLHAALVRRERQGLAQPGADLGVGELGFLAHGAARRSCASGS